MTTPFTRRAPFITIEGVDGAGKSSCLPKLLAALNEAGFEVVQTQEPGGSELGSRLRMEIKETVMNQQTAALLAFAARSEHLSQKIRPALHEGKAVISDRFTDSTFAYQGGGDGYSWNSIEVLEQLVHSDCCPDLTLLFDLPGEVAEARRQKRLAVTPEQAQDKFDAKSIEWFEKVRGAYLRRFDENPERFALIDASGTMEQVAKQVEKVIVEFMEKWPQLAAQYDQPSRHSFRSARP